MNSKNKKQKKKIKRCGEATCIFLPLFFNTPVAYLDLFFAPFLPCFARQDKFIFI